MPPWPKLYEKEKNNMVKKLSVITPMLNEELDNYIEGFSKYHHSSINLISQFTEFILIIQGEKEPDSDIIKKLLKIFSPTIIFSTIKSTSHARNIGIEYITKKQAQTEKVIFLDSDSFIDQKSWTKIYEICQNSENLIHETKINWDVNSTPPIIQEVVNADISKKLWQNRMFRTYLWSLIIPTDLVIRKKLRFDEKLGPGEKTLFKSGEDTLFLLELLQNYPMKFIHIHSNIYVHHPDRPSDNSKQLTYAFGQGNLFKLLFSKNKNKLFSIYLLFWLLLFIGNTIFMVASLKPNAIEIAKMRFKGLLSL